MTGTELYNSVLQLGFSQSFDELEPVFYEAANLALCQLSRLFPEEAVREITVSPGEGYYTTLRGKDLDPRFLGFSHTPLFFEGRGLIPGRDYLLRGGSLLVPSERTGIPLTLCYCIFPRRLTPDNREEALSLEGQAEHLLPLLTASILWEQDDPELANRYYSLYRAALGEAQRERIPRFSAGMLSTNGWDL